MAGGGTKFAVTAMDELTETVHVKLKPEQAPPQPPKVVELLESGAAVNVTVGVTVGS